MPCYATGSAEGDARLTAEEQYSAATEATRAACEMAKLLRSKGPKSFSKLSLQTRAWVEKHDKIDEERIERDLEETKRKSKIAKALNKLSTEDKEALGLL